MLKYLLVIIIGILLSCVNNNNPNKSSDLKVNNYPKNKKLEVNDSGFLYHFAILDSAVKLPPYDTMYHCCYNSISYMEFNTGIEADVEGDYSGATGFKKSDLENWHNWYDSIKSLQK